MLQDRVAFAWRSMTPSMKKTSASWVMRRICTTATTSGRTSRHLVVREGNRVHRRDAAPLVLTSRLRAPLVHPRDDIDESALTPVEGRRFCRTRPGQLLRHRAEQACRLVLRRGMVRVAAFGGSCRRARHSGRFTSTAGKLALEPGQAVIPHGMTEGSTDESAAAQSRSRRSQVSSRADAISPLVVTDGLPHRGLTLPLATSTLAGGGLHGTGRLHPGCSTTSTQQANSALSSSPHQGHRVRCSSASPSLTRHQDRLAPPTSW